MVDHATGALIDKQLAVLPPRGAGVHFHRVVHFNRRGVGLIDFHLCAVEGAVRVALIVPCTAIAGAIDTHAFIKILDRRTLVIVDRHAIGRRPRLLEALGHHGATNWHG